MKERINKMNVLSLCDGISGGQIALERAEIKVDRYYASEINIHAIKVTQHNYPNTIQLGDITLLDENKLRELPKIDLLIGGTPCQGFSICGKKLNFEDPRSKLFFEYVRILNWLKENNNPNIKFLLENVKMKQEWVDIITSYLKVEPTLINSNLLSAQNRERYYWTNILDNIKQPEDKHIYLKDILEKQIDTTLIVDKNKINNPVFKKNYLQWDIKGKGNNSQDQRAFYLDGKHGTLPSTGGGSKSKVLLDKDKLIAKKLSCIEAERLQTLTDNYTACLSDSKRHEVIGNGWTIDIIVHILKHLNRINYIVR
jgi:DNA-cytosine methyltransferase